MLSFEPLRLMLVRRNMNYSDLAKMTGVSLPTLYRAKRDDPVSFEVLDKICTALDVRIEDVIEHKKNAAEE